MADDIDDLLDEVERKYCSKPPPIVPVPPKKVSSTMESVSCASSEIDDLISDVYTDYPGVSQAPSKSSRDAEKKGKTADKASIEMQKRCTPLLLGGSNTPLGHSSYATQRACDQLRCISCDFKVIWFDDCAWHTRSDYLFFRNNVPDYERLKINLVRKKGTRAYACQCSWHSVEENIEVVSLTTLKWVCGKH